MRCGLQNELHADDERSCEDCASYKNERDISARRARSRKSPGPLRTRPRGWGTQVVGRPAAAHRFEERNGAGQDLPTIRQRRLLRVDQRTLTLEHFQVRNDAEVELVFELIRRDLELTFPFE